ncbi:MAG: FecR family protein [Lacibacter sp.]
MAFSKQYYEHLSLEELVQDDFFIESVKQPNEKTKTFWTEFVLQYPQRKADVDTAESFVKHLKFEQQIAEPGVKEKLWQAITAQASAAPEVVPMFNRKRWMWAAATLAGVLFVSAAWLFLQKSSFTNFTAQYGEVKQLVLPDQSVVTLNANSVLKYKKEWKEGMVREVWLEGEAFFDVKHLHEEGNPVKASDRFLVHVGDMTVEVLGTSFNVSDRKAETKVVLQTGKVRVDFKDKKKESMLMEPGDLVKYNQSTKQVVKEKTDTISTVAWKKKELMLNNTSVQDIINSIENNFGYKVEVADPALLTRKLAITGATATISLENEQTLFEILEVSLNVEITKTNDTLYIR